MRIKVEIGVMQPQETPGATGNWKRLGRIISKTFREIHNPAETLISDYFFVTCCGNPKKLIHRLFFFPM